MARKRINFDKMSHNAYAQYLHQKSTRYDKFVTTTIMGLSVLKITPHQSRMIPRIFDCNTGNQLDNNIELTQIDLQLKNLTRELVRAIDSKIQNMATKGVYYPRRLKPRWGGLKTDRQKIQLFTRYMKETTPSIGLNSLMKANMPEKTLESILLDHPQFEQVLQLDNAKQNCIDKFKKYPIGVEYLNKKGII